MFLFYVKVLCVMSKGGYKRNYRHSKHVSKCTIILYKQTVAQMLAQYFQTLQFVCTKRLIMHVYQATSVATLKRSPNTCFPELKWIFQVNSFLYTTKLDYFKDFLNSIFRRPTACLSGLQVVLWNRLPEAFPKSTKQNLGRKLYALDSLISLVPNYDPLNIYRFLFFNVYILVCLYEVLKLS